MTSQSKKPFSKIVFSLSLLYLILFTLSIVTEAGTGIISFTIMDILAYSAVLSLIVITTVGCFCYMSGKMIGWATFWKFLALLWVLLILGSCGVLFYEDNYTTTEAGIIAFLVAIVLFPVTYGLWDYGNILKQPNIT